MKVQSDPRFELEIALIPMRQPEAAVPATQSLTGQCIRGERLSKGTSGSRSSL